MNHVKQFIDGHFNLSSFYVEIFATLRANLEHCPFQNACTREHYYLEEGIIIFVAGFFHVLQKGQISELRSDTFDIIAMLIRKKIHGDTAQKMKFSIKNFLSKCDQIRSFLWIWSHLLTKSLMENFISSFFVQREVFNYYASGERLLQRRIRRCRLSWDFFFSFIITEHLCKISLSTKTFAKIHFFFQIFLCYLYS